MKFWLRLLDPFQTELFEVWLTFLFEDRIMQSYFLFHGDRLIVQINIIARSKWTTKNSVVITYEKITFYYMANPVLGKSMCSNWFLHGQDFAVRTVSMETVQSVYFCFGAKAANSTFATKTAKKKV